MNPSLIKFFIYIIVSFFAFITYSNNNSSTNCQSTFSPKSTRLEQLQEVIHDSIRDKAINHSLIEDKVIYAHEALEDFLKFLDPITLELKDMTSEEISKYKFGKLRQMFVKQEIIESAVLKEVPPNTMIKEFLDTQNRSAKNLPHYWIQFLELYVGSNNLSFRREVYKFELFTILFGGIFPELSHKQVSALVSPEWKKFFKKHAKKLFTNKIDIKNRTQSVQDWRRQLQDFIFVYEIEPTEIVTQLKIEEPLKEFFDSTDPPLSQSELTLAHDKLKNFLKFLDPATLELKDMTNEEISQYTFSEIRQELLKQETIESKLLNEVDSQKFIKEFLYIYDRTEKDIDPSVFQFLKLYVEHLSFRREVYKFDMFMMLFGNIFPELSYKISVLGSPKWKDFFREHASKTFGNTVGIDLREDIKEWNLYLRVFIEHYDELKPQNFKQ